MRRCITSAKLSLLTYIANTSSYIKIKSTESISLEVNMALIIYLLKNICNGDLVLCLFVSKSLLTQTNNVFSISSWEKFKSRIK